MIRVFLCFVLVLSTAAGAAAESSVWKAQKGAATLYVGGTFHMLRSTDYPLPPEYDRAYRAAQVLVFETDLDRFRDPALQRQLLAKATYADGSTLAQHLSPETYGALTAYCAANTIPLQLLERFKPSMLMVTLTLLELLKQGATREGVDQYFFALAKQDQKAVRGLETAEEQIDYLVAMADGNEDDFVRHALGDMATLKEQFATMADAWRRGDVEQLDGLLNRNLKDRSPSLYQRLIIDRNRQWLPIIDSYQRTPETEFVLVGVGHLVGPEGLLAALRSMGYTVSKL
jgi:uncharacterized protein